MTAKVDVPPADPRRKRGQWAADAGPDVLAGLGAARTGAASTLRTAAARCVRDQARYLGGRPPYVTGRCRAHPDKTRRARPQPRRM
jgi:hypothetical protein